LTERVELAGGACEKHVNPGHRGDPDRLVSFQSGYVCLVETKWAEIAPLPEYQSRRHRFWRNHGIDVYVIKSVGGVDIWMQTMHDSGYWG
jgi:hypothetical protein